MSIYISTKRLANYLFGSPDRDRLAGAITETWVEFDNQIRSGNSIQFTEPWVRAAYQFLLQSEEYLADWNVHQGWVALLSAQRALLSGSADGGRIEVAAIALRREAEKITGWRSKAIEDLICGSKGELRQDLQITPPDKLDSRAHERVISALSLRDDRFHTTYFKIMLRRRHLFQLFLALWISIASCLLLSYLGWLPPPLDNRKLVAVVVLFGMLGACLSVAQGLLTSDISDKIPAQQIGSFVIWMRPGIGAAAALVTLVLLHANKTFKVFGWDTYDPTVIMTIAFVAGYSERFIVGAVERISQIKDKSEKSKE